MPFFEEVKDFFSDIFESQLPPEYKKSVRDEQSQTTTEEASEIPADEKDKFKPYIFTQPQSFQYPLKVGESDDQPHSVRFYINARENSRVAETTNANIRDNTNAAIEFYGGFGKAGDENDLKAPNATAENRANYDQAAGNSTALAGAAAGGAILKKFAGSKASPLATGGAVIGGAITAKVISSAVIKSVNKVRTLGAIELYVAAPPVAQYSANWENKELGPLAGLKEFSIGNLLSGAGGIGELAARGAIRAAANLPGEFGIGGELGASVNLAEARVANPYKEQLFSNMGFRQFAFNYKFNPKNETEYKHVQRIIQLFKYHMHPEVSSNKLFLEYPSEFNIEYHYYNRESGTSSQNKHVSKISSCALTDVKITYGNQDAFTTIKGTNGAPAEINMQLAFTELETLTNERIADGF